MAFQNNKRSPMTLYTTAMDPYSHKVRLVLAEKGISADIIEVSSTQELPEDLLQINPRGAFPMMVDRDLILYETDIIIEYLEERFPHPSLLPVYPVARAKNRQMMQRIERDWYQLAKQIETGTEEEATIARKILRDSLVSLDHLFSTKPYFLNDEFSLVDCYLAPLLWRLPKLGIELPLTAKNIRAYTQRLFKRPTFKASLTDAEQDIAA